MPLLPYFRLMRPANIVTALADILLGYAAAMAVSHEGLPLGAELGWLLLATAGLYGGGVVLNDVFDADLDRLERPERPIPSGGATERGAMLLGILLLLIGIGSAAQVSARSAIIALIVGGLAVIYDAYGKHHSWLGPLNMGACRSGNLLLGMSVLPLSALSGWLALIPLIYIAAITMISRGEVHGGSRPVLYRGLALYSLVILLILVISGSAGSLLPALPLTLLFALFIIPPLLRAIRQPEGPRIGAAVKAGVLGLIAMDAALAAGFAGIGYGLAILLLLPVSLILGRIFAVT